ncbi:MAG TPA: hypothetical protein VJM51_04740 [Dehalococcoidia bacterium]|nr:hypothetical protein [Dehalococcoidia bacterium]HLE79779.1 hypothetical protein [Dehalococcoidia bacterium]
MVAYDLFLISLAIVFAVTTALLSVLGAERWDLYYGFYLMEYLAVSTLFAFLNPRARTVLNRITYILIPGFGVILALKVAEILWGVRL